MGGAPGFKMVTGGSPRRGRNALVLALAALCGGGPALAVTVLSPSSQAGEPGPAETVGHSVKDRPIEVRRTGVEGSPTRVLIVGEIHGNEPAGRPVVRALEEVAPPEGVEMWMMRDLNPDGLARGTRQNARGVDLNRNFPRAWREHGEPGSTYYSGPHPLSEPESRAGARLIRRIEPDVTVWYHQALNLVAESPGADLSLVRRYAEIVNLPTERLEGLHGTATRWQNHRDPDSSGFVVELGGGSLTDPQLRKHVRAVRAVSRLAGGS